VFTTILIPSSLKHTNTRVLALVFNTCLARGGNTGHEQEEGGQNKVILHLASSEGAELRYNKLTLGSIVFGLHTC
jgi:hypothetical protein